MRLYQAGDRSAGVCEHCKARVQTQMEYRDYTPTGWDVVVPDVLVAACERCGRVVAMPHQSMPKINEYRVEAGEAPTRPNSLADAFADPGIRGVTRRKK